MAVKPSHDGAIAVIRDRELLFSIEPEKDSNYRHEQFLPDTLFNAASRVGEIPDVVALGGWDGPIKPVGAGYTGLQNVMKQPRDFFGKEVTFFSTSHERSHVSMAVGMAPPDDF
jgi:hydroxymethyl cephem carbamoyltransferase